VPLGRTPGVLAFPIGGAGARRRRRGRAHGAARRGHRGVGVSDACGL